MRVLVTRPEPECERTAALLRERGHEPLVMPLLRIEPIADAELGAGPWAAVLFTSANGVRAIAAHRRFGDLADLPVYTVGQRTRAMAAAAGLTSIISADGDVNALVELVASKPPKVSLPCKRREGTAAPWPEADRAPADIPLLYCAGEERSGDLAGALHLRGLRVETAVVYRSVPVTAMTPDVHAAMVDGRVDAVLHYSARTAAAFVAAATAAGVRDLSNRIRHLCLSVQVAGPLAAAGAKSIEIASEPSEQALLARVGPA